MVTLDGDRMTDMFTLQTTRASCSCWWGHLPPLDGQNVGAIGHYNAADDDSGAWLLNEACRRLRDEAGCGIVVAPMDGTTWQRYRLIIDRGTEPPFFLEPDNPDTWPSHLEAAGFAPLATYTSALNSDLTQADPRAAGAAERLAGRGVTIRTLDLANPAAVNEDLRRIFKLSLVSFSKNFLYTPIDEDEFLAQYRAVLPVVRPELVLLAEDAKHQGELVGFLFAVPDMLEMRRIGRVDTVIVKTVAIKPGLAYAGLGTLLTDRIHRDAHAHGFRRAIHALMHEDNVSRNISKRYATTIRRYALFAKRLV
jgi:hypothetical protein